MLNHFKFFSIRLVLFIAFSSIAGKYSYSQTFVSGKIYYDSTGYVEYRAGNLPIILSSPHGGSLQPSTIPDRDCQGCVYVKDSWTEEITDGLYNEFLNKTGCYPHVIINKLHRIKFDANRNLSDAADGNPTVELAWQAYHNFIDVSKKQIKDNYGKGLFLDIHGHAHSIQRIELGYLLSPSELNQTDTELNTNFSVQKSSIKSLVGNNIQSLSHSQLLRGNKSFGTLLDAEGFPSVPSTQDPFPKGGEPYFSGGYNTEVHGSKNSNSDIDAIQIELNSEIRFDASKRELLMKTIVKSANEYFNIHYNENYANNFCNLILGLNDNKSNNKLIKIYPNPSYSFFTIEGELNGIEMSIFNNLGQKIQSKMLTENFYKIDNLNKGLYHIQLKNDAGILENFKLIKN